MTETSSIRRLAGVLNVLSILAIFVLIAVVVFAALVADLPPELRDAAGVAAERDLPRRMLIITALIGAIPMLAMIYVLQHMSGLFRLYAAGETLSFACADHIRRIGAGLLASAVLEFLTRPLQIMVASLLNPPGERVLAIGFGSADLGMLLAAGLMLTIGWVMADAARIAEENRGFI